MIGPAAPRAIALSLSMALGLPDPALALRIQATKQSSGLEEFTAVLTGLEENPEEVEESLSVRIRPMRRNRLELAEVVAIEELAEHLGEGNWSPADFSRFLRIRNNEILVAVHEKRIVGFLAYERIFSDDDPLSSGEESDLDQLKEVWIWSPVVHPDFQGKGVERQLIERVILHVRRRHPLVPFVERTHMLDEGARSHFIPLGFKGRLIPDEFGQGEDAFEMFLRPTDSERAHPHAVQLAAQWEWSQRFGREKETLEKRKYLFLDAGSIRGQAKYLVVFLAEVSHRRQILDRRSRKIIPSAILNAPEVREFLGWIHESPQVVRQMARVLRWMKGDPSLASVVGQMKETLIWLAETASRSRSRKGQPASEPLDLLLGAVTGTDASGRAGPSIPPDSSPGEPKGQNESTGLEEGGSRREFLKRLAGAAAQFSGLGEALGTLAQGFGRLAATSSASSAPASGSSSWQAHRGKLLELVADWTGTRRALAALDANRWLADFDAKMVAASMGDSRDSDSYSIAVKENFLQGIEERIKESHRLVGYVHNTSHWVFGAVRSERRHAFFKRLRSDWPPYWRERYKTVLALEDEQLAQGIAWANQHSIGTFQSELSSTAGYLKKLAQSVSEGLGLGEVKAAKSTKEAKAKREKATSTAHARREKAQRIVQEVVESLIPGGSWHLFSLEATRRYPGLRVLAQEAPRIFLLDDEAHAGAILKLMEQTTPIDGIHAYGTEAETAALRKLLFSDPKPLQELTESQWVAHPLTDVSLQGFLQRLFANLPRAAEAPAIDWGRLARALALLAGT